MKRRWRRIVLAVGIVAVLCTIYGWFFGFQTMMLWETHKIARRAPVVNQTPSPLPDTSISPGPGTKLSYFGYDFEVPWDDLDLAKSKTQSNPVILRFRSGKSLMFASAPPRYFVNVLSNEMGKQVSLREVYADKALQSDYAMWSTILAATPGNVNLFSPPKDIIANNMQLLIKAVAIPEKSGMFYLATRSFRGFQWGDPKKQPEHVVADLFADDGGLEFVFFANNKTNPQGISQVEINRVLQSVQKTTERLSQSASRPAQGLAVK